MACGELFQPSCNAVPKVREIGKAGGETCLPQKNKSSTKQYYKGIFVTECTGKWFWHLFTDYNSNLLSVYETVWKHILDRPGIPPSASARQQPARDHMGLPNTDPDSKNAFPVNNIY